MILMEKWYVCQNTHLQLAFMVRIPSQTIYISTICNVRMMLERIAVVRVPCTVRRSHVIYAGGGDGSILIDRCIMGIC